MFPTKGERCSQEGKLYSKGGDMPSESSHEGEVERQGEEQKGESWFQREVKPSLDGGKHPSKCKWFNLVKLV